MDVELCRCTLVEALHQREEEEKRLLEDMDEEEYDGLPDEKKEEIDAFRLIEKKEKRRKRFSSENSHS